MLFVLLSVGAMGGGENAIAITATGLDAEGVALIAPNTAGFDSLVAKIMDKEAAGPALWLKPFLVIVSNQTSHTVVAYDILWKLTYNNGRSEDSYVQFKYPDAVAGAPDTGMFAASREPQPLPPGKQKLSAMSLEFGPEIVAVPGWREFLRDGTRNQASAYAGVNRIEIKLDAAVFEDGTLIGRDEGNLGANFAAYLEEKQKLFRAVVAGLDSGQSMNQAFSPIQSSATAKVIKEMAGNPFAIYRTLAAQEIIGLRDRIGAQAVYHVFKSAVRKEPFLIHRAQIEPQGRN